VALFFSNLTVAGCIVAGVPWYLILLIAGSYGVWMITAYRRYHRAVRWVAEARLISEEESVMERRHFSDVEKYYFRLLISMNESTRMLAAHITNTLVILGRMDDRVDQAGDFAKNTELLAVNAMMSAVRCGEVGRGFVSVSKDLVGISKRAEHDLLRLSNLIQGLTSNLSTVGFLPENAALSWIELELEGNSEYPLTSVRCGAFHASVAACLRILDELHQAYESTSQLDVRWLQLGEAIRRVVTGLRDTLQSLLHIVENLTADVQLLSLTEHLDRQQLVEIHEGFLQFVEHHDKMNEIIS
jgi:hypothetical protein